MIKDNDVKYVDFRFTDPRGKWQHVTFDVTMIEEDTFAEGQMFDGSSIAGWKAINESDMSLMPDPAIGLHRSVLRRDHAGAGLRRARADHRRALQPRPARHRQEGRGHGQVDGRRRHHLLRPRGRVLRVRRRASIKADPYNTGFKLDSVEFPTNSDTDYEGGNLGHRIGTKKGYFPVPPQDSRAGHALGNARRHGADGLRGREASPRGGLGPARARPEVRAADDDGRPDADLQVLHPPGRQHLRQDRDLHAEADLRRQRLGHALPPVDLEGRQAGVRRQQVRRPVGDLPVLHRRHHQARQGDQRLHQPDHQLLQASGAGLRGAGAARLFGAQPLGLVPHPLHHQPEGQARRGPLPRSARQSVSRLRRDADGRPRRHQEQAPSRRGDGQGPLRSAAEGTEEDPDGVRLAARGARRTSTRTATSSRPAACSTTTSSTATSS